MARMEISEVVAVADGAGKLSTSANAQVLVTVAGTQTPASVYSSATGPALAANPIITTGNGRVEGWLEEGAYDLIVSQSVGPGYTQRIEALAGLKQSTNEKGQPGGYAGLSTVSGDTGKAIDAYTGSPRSVGVSAERLPLNIYDFGGRADSGTTDNLAAFAAAKAALPASGGIIDLGRAGTGELHFSAGVAWDDKPVTVRGESSGIQPGTGTRVRFPSSAGFNPRNGAGGLGARSRIEHLRILGGGAALAGRYGVKAEASEMSMRDVVIEDFGDHGLWVNSDGTIARNINIALFEHVRCYHNFGNGIFVEGGDSNACVFTLPDCTGNAGWNFLDNSGLGNLYLGPHAAADGLTTYLGLGDYRLGGTGRHVRIVGGYSEFVAGRTGLQIDATNSGRHVLDFANMDNIVSDLTTEKNSVITWPKGDLHQNRLAIGDGTNIDFELKAGAAVAEGVASIRRGRAINFQNLLADCNWFLRANAAQQLEFASAQGKAVLFSNPLSLNSSSAHKRVNASIVGEAGVDVSTGDIRQLTLTGNVTLLFFTGATDGQLVTTHIIQDATGSRLVTWATNFKFAGATPVLTTTANKRDIFTFQHDGPTGNWIEVSRSMNVG